MLDIGQRLLAHVSGTGDRLRRLRLRRPPGIERVQHAVGTHQVRIRRGVIRDELRVQGRDLVHREVRVERVRVGVGTVVEAVVRVERARPCRAPPVLHDERRVIDRVLPDRVEIVVERADLRRDRRLGVLLRQELPVGPSPVVAPAATARRAPHRACVEHPVVEHLREAAGAGDGLVHHEACVPVDGRAHGLERVELKRRGEAVAVAHGDVVLPEMRETDGVEVVIAAAAQRGHRGLRRILRGERVDLLRRVQIDLRRHVRCKHHPGDDGHVEEPFAVELALHVVLARDLEELERVGMALPCSEHQAGVRQVAAVRLLDGVRVHVEDVEPVCPLGGSASRCPRAARVFALHPVVHVLEAGSGARVRDHEQVGTDTARALHGDVRAVASRERVIDGPRLVNDVVVLKPVLVEGQGEPDVAELDGLARRVRQTELPRQVTARQRVGLDDLEILDAARARGVLVRDGDAVA